MPMFSFEGLTPQTVYYFAIVAFDEAGAFEPRFTLDSNVLQFRPTLGRRVQDREDLAALAFIRQR